MRAAHNFLRAVLLIAGFSLAGCISHPDQKRVYSYTCADGYQFTTSYARDEESLLFTDAEREVKLKQIRSASGARYTDGEEFVLVTKGLMAFIRLEGEVIHAECMGDNAPMETT